MTTVVVLLLLAIAVYAIWRALPNGTPPTVSLRAPTGGARLAGRQLIRASVKDKVSVTKVEFYAGGTPLGVVTAFPYQYHWDTTTVPNGRYVVVAKAFDSNGEVGTSPSSTVVRVENANAGPSGEPMPVGDIPGWHQVFADDFRTDPSVPVGGFSGCADGPSLMSSTCSGLPSSVAAKWWAYPDGWKDTSGNGIYYPSKVLSIQHGVLNYYLHSENGIHMVATLVPKIPGGVDIGGLLYGRYMIRFKADPLPEYKTTFQLWPDSERWPTDGEIDFPEANLNWSRIFGFVHRQGAASGGEQDEYSIGGRYAFWHTAVIDWRPHFSRFMLDGRIVGTSTRKIPDTPMHWVLQVETASLGLAPHEATAGNLQVAWVTAYTPA